MLNQNFNGAVRKIQVRDSLISNSSVDHARKLIPKGCIFWHLFVLSLQNRRPNLPPQIYIQTKLHFGFRGSFFNIRKRVYFSEISMDINKNSEPIQFEIALPSLIMIQVQRQSFRYSSFCIGKKDNTIQR